MMSTFGKRFSGGHPFPGRSVAWRRKGNANRKSASVSRAALHFNSSTMRLHNLFGEREPEAAALGIVHQAAAHAIELFKNTFVLGLRDADALILHGNLELIAVFRDAYAQFLPVGRILDGIVDQITQCLGDGFRVDSRAREM